MTGTDQETPGRRIVFLLIICLASFFLWKLARHIETEVDWFLLRDDLKMQPKYYLLDGAFFIREAIITYIVYILSPPIIYVKIAIRTYFAAIIMKTIFYWCYFYDVPNTHYTIGLVLYLLFETTFYLRRYG